MLKKIIRKAIVVIFITSIVIAGINETIPYLLSRFIDNINNYEIAIKIIGLFLILTLLLFIINNIVKIVI